MALYSLFLACLTTSIFFISLTNSCIAKHSSRKVSSVVDEVLIIAFYKHRLLVLLNFCHTDYVKKATQAKKNHQPNNHPT